MKETGVVRRIDDLGRVVIPKEMRRMLRLREGDPMELFMDGDVVVLRKYNPLCGADWVHIREVLRHVVEDFCLLDQYGDLAIAAGLNFPNQESASSDKNAVVYPVQVMGETLGYLVVGANSDAKLVEIALKQYTTLLREKEL